MTSLRYLLCAVAVATATSLTSAGAQSWAAWSTLLGTPVGETLAELGAAALLTPFTGWTTSAAIVLTVVSSTVAARDASLWWRPSTVATGVLLAWTCAAWTDGARSARALLAGRPSQTWFAWPGEATPLHWSDPLAPTTWSLDLLSATGPLVVVVSLWVGPLVLRDLASRRTTLTASALRRGTTAVPAPTSGTAVPVATDLTPSTGPMTSVPAVTSVPAAPGAGSSGSVARAALVREVHRTSQVAGAVWVLLCAGVVLLQVSGGILVVVSSTGGTGWAALLDPGFLVMLLALSAAWRLGGPRVPSTAPVRPWRGAVASLLLAVVVVASLVRSEIDLVMLVAGASGVLVAATRTTVSTSAVRFLLADPARGASSVDGGPVRQDTLVAERVEPAGPLQPGRQPAG